MKKILIKFLAVISATLLVGCKEAKQPELVAVKCVEVHLYGDTIKTTGSWHEQFTHMVVERQDTKERKSFSIILGKVDDVFTMDWNTTNY